VTFEPKTNTTEKLDGQGVRQFSIFLQNKVGALLEIVKLLNERSIHVLALNVQDSADSSIVRIVASDPEQVQDLFALNDIPFATCDLVVVELREGAAELGKVLAALLMAEVNIHGSYALMTRPRGRCALALHVEDNECAAAVLRSHGIPLLTQADLSR
jgi:hypothetical protein